MLQHSDNGWKPAATFRNKKPARSLYQNMDRKTKTPSDARQVFRSPGTGSGFLSRQSEGCRGTAGFEATKKGDSQGQGLPGADQVHGQIKTLFYGR